MERKCLTKTSLHEFYRDKCAFITGATGFVGSVLVERLLYNFEDIGTIYLLIRCKNAEDLVKRFNTFINGVLFSLLSEKQKAKVIPVAGSIEYPKFGLSHEDYEMVVNNTNLVFNSAANVRFDETLPTALKTNSGGCLNMLNICRDMKKLEAVIHVSTAYCTPSLYVKEKVIDLDFEMDDIIEILKNPDITSLQVLSEKIMDNFKNTYAYSKCMSENIIAKGMKDLPIAIFRPAVVFSTSRYHTFPGYIGNLFGPASFYPFISTGLLRYLYFHPDLKCNLVPADYCSNVIIMAAKDIAETRYDDVKIYNYLPEDKYNLTMDKASNLIIKLNLELPMLKVAWYPKVECHKSFYVSIFWSILTQVPMCIFIDIKRMMKGNKPILMKKQLMFISMYKSWSTIVNENQHYELKNVKQLRKKFSNEEHAIFPSAFDDTDWKNNIAWCIHGFNKYILKFKDNPRNVAIRLKELKRLKVLYYGVNAVVIGLLILLGLKILVQMVGNIM